MKHIVIKNFEDFILQVMSIGNANDGLLAGVVVETNEDGSLKTYMKDNKSYVEVVGTYPMTLLFRGQSSDYQLIPKLGRIASGGDLPKKELSMITEIKRRTNNFSISHFDEFDILVYGQHYGLATRLLDWTTNPLVALWFACMNENIKTNSFVYLLKQSDDKMIDKEIDKSPFNISETKILKPNLNSDRIVAQNGWFTIHTLDKDKRNFIALNNDVNYQNELWKFEIPHRQKELILIKLNMLGINYEYIYPGIEGTCNFINWKHKS